MDITRLKYFLAVARTLNFTKAADALYISHSTVSRAVAELEKEFNVTLCERNNRSVKLTPAGTFLAEKSKELVRLSDELDLAMRKFGKEQLRVFRISTFNFFNNTFFRKIEQFRLDNPSTDVVFKHCDILSEIISSVESGESDVGLTFSFTLEGDKRFCVLPIQSGEFVLLVSSSNPLAARSSIDIRDPDIEKPMMIDELVYPQVRSVGENALFHKNSDQMFRASDLNSFILHIKANLGIGIVPEHLATQVGQGCSLVNLDGVDSTYQLVLFYRRDNRDPLVQKLIRQF